MRFIRRRWITCIGYMVVFKTSFIVLTYRNTKEKYNNIQI